VAGRYGFILPGSLEEKLVGLAVAQKGKSYIWAAKGLSVFDYFGLTLYIHAQLEVEIPRNSEAQYFEVELITNDQLRPVICYVLSAKYLF
jgi:cell wall-associated NlpC family hydrolase